MEKRSIIDIIKVNKKKIIAFTAIIVALGIILNFKFSQNKDISDSLDNQSKVEASDNEINNSEKSSKEKPITKGDFAFEVEEPIDYNGLTKKGMPVIGDYGSEKCGPCRTFEPTLIRLNREYEGKAFIKYIDVWEHQDGAEDIPVKVIPTQNFVGKDGKPYNPSPEKVKKYNLMQVKDENGNLKYTMHEGLMKYEYLVEILDEMIAKK